VPSDYRYKLAPRLRHVLDADAPSGATGKSAADARVIIEVADRTSRARLEKLDGVDDFVCVLDGYCTATVRSKGSSRLLSRRLTALLNDPGVVEIEGVRSFRPQLYNSVKAVHGRTAASFVRNDPNAATQGRGAVIGIVDYGLDYMLPAFLDDAGVTRIAYLWDQQLAAGTDGAPPAKYGYGVEYTSSDIEKARKAQAARRKPQGVVKHNPRQPEAFADVDGHGTVVTGIAAGRAVTVRAGASNPPAGEYMGVAPGATLVFVNLNRRTTLDHTSDSEGTLANSIELIHAIAYCFEKADALNMPCVVNLSMGFNGGGHDGNTAVEAIIDALLATPGRAVVIAAGNENAESKRNYFGGTVARGAPLQLGWYNGEMQGIGDDSIPRDDPTQNELEIWYSRDSRLRVRVMEPANSGTDRTGWVRPGAFRVFKLKSGEHVEITSDPHTAWDGDARIHIKLSPGTRESGIREGKWLVELDALKVGAGERGGVRIDAWVERTIAQVSDSDYLSSELLDYDGEARITLTTPATARRAIAVASFDDKSPDPTISDFSGRGPTRTGPTSPERRKPDVAAPGARIWSVNAGAADPANAGDVPRLVLVAGTSMAAPHVTGIVARLLSRQHFLTSSEIRDILGQTAQLADGMQQGEWHPQWGYGIVDAEAAMRKLEEKLGER
jgi:subtilisin family serine protease